jgi:hypothetical protein
MKQLGVVCVVKIVRFHTPFRLDRRTISAKQAAQKPTGRRNTNQSQVWPNASEPPGSVTKRSKYSNGLRRARPTFDLEQIK